MPFLYMNENYEENWTLINMNINKRHSTMLLAIRFNLREEQYSLISISNSRTTSSVANVFE